MQSDAGKVHLNIYLLKRGSEMAEVIKTPKVRAHVLLVGGLQIGTVYTKTAHANSPRWAKFFKDAIPVSIFGKNSSTGAVVIVEAGERMFAMAFGQGRHLLESEFIENNFGLRVTLNSVDENNLRSIDKASFEEHPHQSREQSGKAGQLQTFSVDVERDLLRAVTGRPVDPAYGERISGMDSLKLSIELQLSGIQSLLTDLLKAYENDAYKQKVFAFVDHIQEMRDASLCEKLDSALIDKINAGDYDNTWLAVPEIVDWERAVGFKYSSSPKDGRVSDVRLDELLKSFEGMQIDKTALLRRKICCVDAEDVPVFNKSAYYWIYAEVPYDGKTYLLNNGKWYRVDEDFVTLVNQFYNHVVRYKKSLPVFEAKDKTEGPYNERVADLQPNEFALMDKKNIKVPGAASPVEPCDLYRSPKEFIHVKKYGGSSVLSHLFNQGVVSAELFKREIAFRQEMNDRLPAKHKIANIEDVPQQNEYTVVYAVVSEYDQSLSIPFFSKITLRHAVQRLTSLGFSVALAKIGVDADWKVLKVIPTVVQKKKKAAARA